MTIHKEKTPYWQLNANTIMLSIIIGGIGWVMHQINDLDIKVAVQQNIQRADGKAINDQNRVLLSHSAMIQEQAEKITRLETLLTIDQKK